MGILESLKGELLEIVEWKSESRDEMVHRFEHRDSAIKHGAQLIVREGQAAVFINEGALADVYPPGRYKLITQNMPVLTKLMGWKYGFKSPFKVDVYFVGTRQFTNLKWGVKNPIMLRDEEFGPIRLRAFGTYAIKIPPQGAGTFLQEIVGTDGDFTSDSITNHLRDMLVARFADVLGESHIPALDLAANYDELGTFVFQKIAAEFLDYGIELTKFLVENISLPPAVEEALDKRASMGVIGDLSAYTQFQAAQAMEAAAQNPGGGAAEGMGLGMGFAMANQMARSMAPQAQSQSGPAAPPPIPQGASFHVAVNGQASGPFDPATLQQQVQAGQFTRDSLVWKEGMAQWAKAGDVPELQGLFGAAPPPIPPGV